MPKLKTISYKYKGSAIDGVIHVTKDGEFYIKKPFCDGEKLTAKTAEALEQDWKAAARAAIDQVTETRKVIAVRFNSNLLSNRNSVFIDRGEMLSLECNVFEERKLTVGGEVKISYVEHPELAGMHREGNHPFPSMFRLSANAANFHIGELVVADWSPELERLMTKACEGIVAVVEMLDGAFKSNESLQSASARQLTFKP